MAAQRESIPRLTTSPPVQQRAESLFRRLGARHAALYLLSRVLSASSRGWVRLYKDCLVVQPVPLSPLVHRESPKGFQVRRVADTDEIVKSFPRHPDVIARRFGNGDVCFTATHHGVFVGFLWLHHGPYDEDEVRCRFTPPGTAVWDYDLHIDPAYRASRAFVRLWDAAYAYLRERDLCWSMSRVSAFNGESLSAHRRLGAKVIATVLFLCVGPLQFASAGRRCPFHLSMSTGQRPDFQLFVPSDSAPQIVVNQRCRQ